MRKGFWFLTLLIFVGGVLLLGPHTMGHETSAHPISSLASDRPAAVTGAITRIAQLDPAQYNSEQDYITWSPSTCSAASMAEVMNAYGLHVRVADVLTVEAALHEISPDLGMLNGSESIAHTVAHFGFQATQMTMTTLDQVIHVANAGHPVIVAFPPARWTGGHLLVVSGGDAQSVSLVDSSILNMHSMARSTFLLYWVGFAVVVMPTGVGGQQ